MKGLGSFPKNEIRIAFQFCNDGAVVAVENGMAREEKSFTSLMQIRVIEGCSECSTLPVKFVR